MLIDWFTVAAQAVNFLILVWLLKRFLYRPVLNAIDEREKRIAGQLQDAEKRKAEAAKEQNDFQQKNADFEKQRDALLLDATNAAKTERDKLLESARTDADALRAKLQKTVQNDFHDLSQKVGALAQKEVFSIARKTLTDLADVSLEERMTHVFVQRLNGMNPQQREELKALLQGSANPALVRCAFDLPAAQKTAVEDAMRSFLRPDAKVEFETKPDLVSGIELAVNGQKITWTIAGYLTLLTDSMTALLKVEAHPAASSDPVVSHAN